MDIEMSLRSLPWISEEIVANYSPIAAFWDTMHHIYLHARLDPSWTWLTLPYRVDDEAIDKKILEWKPEWRPPIVSNNTAYPKNTKKDTHTGGNNPLQIALVVEQVWRVTESLAVEKARRDREEATARRATEEIMSRLAEEVETRKEQEDSTPPAHDAPPGTALAAEVEVATEYEEEQYDTDVVTKAEYEQEEEEEEEPTMGRKKRKVGDNLSQPDKKLGKKASHPKMVHNLTTDDIDMIAVKVSASNEEALTEF